MYACLSSLVNEALHRSIYLSQKIYIERFRHLVLHIVHASSRETTPSVCGFETPVIAEHTYITSKQKLVHNCLQHTLLQDKQ